MPSILLMTRFVADLPGEMDVRPVVGRMLEIWSNYDIPSMLAWIESAPATLVTDLPDNALREMATAVSRGETKLKRLHSQLRYEIATSESRTSATFTQTGRGKIPERALVALENSRLSEEDAAVVLEHIVQFGP